MSLTSSQPHTSADNHQISATGQSPVATNGSVASQTTNTGGGVILSTSGKGATTNTGTQISGTRGNVTVTSADPQVVQNAIDALTQLSAGFANNLSAQSNTSLSAAGSTLDSLSSILNGAESQVGTLAAAQQSGGATTQLKYSLWIIGGGLAVVALIAFFLFRKRS